MTPYVAGRGRGNRRRRRGTNNEEEENEEAGGDDMQVEDIEEGEGIQTEGTERRANQLTEGQRRFNLIHSSTRQKIENSFAWMVMRWRFTFKHLFVKNTERLALVIASCCVLHNLCIDQNDFFEVEVTTAGTRLEEFQIYDNNDGVEMVLQEERDDTEATISGRELNSLLRRLKTEAEAKRLDIQNSL